MIALTPPDENVARFGFALTGLDMNGDGQQDLFVGAPPSSGGRTSTALSYFGSIVMYSKEGSTWSHTATWNGTSFDENLGFAMEAVRVNGKQDTRQPPGYFPPFSFV